MDVAFMILATLVAVEHMYNVSWNDIYKIENNCAYF